MKIDWAAVSPQIPIFIIINDPGTISISKSFTGMKFIIHKTRGRCVKEVRSRDSAFPSPACLLLNLVRIARILGKHFSQWSSTENSSHHLQRTPDSPWPLSAFQLQIKDQNKVYLFYLLLYLFCLASKNFFRDIAKWNGWMCSQEQPNEILQDAPFDRCHLCSF